MVLGHATLKRGRLECYSLSYLRLPNSYSTLEAKSMHVDKKLKQDFSFGKVETHNLTIFYAQNFLPNILSLNLNKYFQIILFNYFRKIR